MARDSVHGRGTWREAVVWFLDYLWPRVKKVSIAYIGIKSTVYILRINNQIKIPDFQNDTLGSTRRQFVQNISGISGKYMKHFLY